ncbi:MAG: hypothetical protein M3Y87_00345 [Myxococcota bacterium]|nr:hypothetical protein [Myxococcota bacterium]
MAKAGVWSFGWVEAEGAAGAELCAVLVDEENELIETSAFAKDDQKSGIAALLEGARAQIGRPRKIVVLDGAVAKALRAAGVREEIVVGRSPVLEEALRTLAETIEAGPMGELLGGEGVEVEHVRAFFEAAARLWEAEPWWLFEPGAAFGVRSEGLGVEEGGVFLMGGDADADEGARENGEESGGGWMFVFAEEDLAALGALVEPGGGDGANVIAMRFERAEEMGAKLDAFLGEHGLSIADGDAVPTLTRSVRGSGMVPPSAKDYELATALCSALTELAAREQEEGWLEAEVVTASGARVLVEGPLDEEDDEDDDAVLADAGDGEEAPDGAWSPPPHPWIAEVESFVPSRGESIGELERRQIHFFCSRSDAHGRTPAQWGIEDLQQHVELITADLPLVRAEIGGVLDALGAWIDARAGLEGEQRVGASIAREREMMIEGAMDPARWSEQKKVIVQLREAGVDLSDPEATQEALARVLGVEAADESRAQRGRSRRPPR